MVKEIKKIERIAKSGKSSKHSSQKAFDPTTRVRNMAIEAIQNGEHDAKLFLGE